MDWRWIYGTLVTATGWTYSVIDRQPMCEIVELLDYLSENPTADMVLRARYLPQRPKKATAIADASQALHEISKETGGAMQAREMPAHIRELAAWAKDFFSRKKL